MKKRDAPFNPLIKSAAASKDLKFRSAVTGDRDAVTLLMSERNPDQDLVDVMKKTDREIALNSSDPDYRLFVAEVNGRVVGLCRYFHSNGLPKEKLTFPAPSGWYCMGLLVDSGFRRQGIARFLFENRLKSLRERGATEVYSMVESSNLASVRMHEEFGFEKIDVGPGFLHIRFAGDGILYRKTV